jgi:hypothetical protein
VITEQTPTLWKAFWQVASGMKTPPFSNPFSIRTTPATG